MAETTDQPSDRERPERPERSERRERPERRERGDRREPRDGRRRSRLSGAQAAERALVELSDLTGKEMTGVVALERTDDGWKVTVETVELRRIPATTDLLATYEVHLDGDGELDGYRRLERYVRGAPDEE